MKRNMIVALLTLGGGTLLAGGGMMMQEKDSPEITGFDTQSAENFRSIDDLGLGDEFDTDGVVFQIQRDSVFKTESTDTSINLSKLMTTDSWMKYCDKSEYSRIDQWGNQVSDCGAGILQVGEGVNGFSGLKHYLKQNTEQSITPGSKVAGEVVITNDTSIPNGNLVGLNAYSLDKNGSPLDLVSILYTDEGVKLSLKRVTTKGISTVYQSVKESSTNGVLGIGMTTNGTLFFEVDTNIYTTDYIMNDPMYVSVNTHAQGVGIDNLSFDDLK